MRHHMEQCSGYTWVLHLGIIRGCHMYVLHLGATFATLGCYIWRHLKSASCAYAQIQPYSLCIRNWPAICNHASSPLLLLQGLETVMVCLWQSRKLAHKRRACCCMQNNLGNKNMQAFLNISITLYIAFSLPPVLFPTR